MKNDLKLCEVGITEFQIKIVTKNEVEASRVNENEREKNNRAKNVGKTDKRCNEGE